MDNRLDKKYGNIAASMDELSQLTPCSKAAAKALQANSYVLTNRDLGMLKKQCSLPADSPQDQSRALDM